MKDVYLILAGCALGAVVRWWVGRKKGGGVAPQHQKQEPEMVISLKADFSGYTKGARKAIKELRGFKLKAGKRKVAA